MARAKPALGAESTDAPRQHKESVALLPLAEQDEPEALIGGVAVGVIGVDDDLIGEGRNAESRKGPDLPRRRVEQLRIERARHPSRQGGDGGALDGAPRA